MPTPAEIRFHEVVQQAAHDISKAQQRQQKVAEYSALRAMMADEVRMRTVMWERMSKLGQELWPDA